MAKKLKIDTNIENIEKAIVAPVEEFIIEPLKQKIPSNKKTVIVRLVSDVFVWYSDNDGNLHKIPNIWKGIKSGDSIDI